jgi:hypothetical protein
VASACLIVLIATGGIVPNRQLTALRPSPPAERLPAGDAPAPIQPSSGVPLLPADPVEAFSRLAQKGGQIDDPNSASGLYHNALLLEAKGEAIGAHRAYYTLARMGLEFIDPHLRYAALVRSHEGRLVARQVYAELNEDVPTRATALVHALQFGAAERRARVNALVEKHPDFAPAYYFLAEEHSADRTGSLQTVQDRRIEYAALTEFLKAEQEGRLAQFFLDHSVALDWLDRAHRRHARLAVLGESASAAPDGTFDP